MISTEEPMSSNQSYWVYILLCENNTLYTGYTNHLEKRFQAHLDGSSKCKFTRSFKPLCILQSWQIQGKSNALKIEKWIKKLSRAKKEALVQKPELLKSHQNYVE